MGFNAGHSLPEVEDLPREEFSQAWPLPRSPVRPLPPLPLLPPPPHRSLSQPRFLPVQIDPPRPRPPPPAAARSLARYPSSKYSSFSESSRDGRTDGRGYWKVVRYGGGRKWIGIDARILNVLYIHTPKSPIAPPQSSFGDRSVHSVLTSIINCVLRSVCNIMAVYCSNRVTDLTDSHCRKNLGSSSRPHAFHVI